MTDTKMVVSNFAYGIIFRRTNTCCQGFHIVMPQQFWYLGNRVDVLPDTVAVSNAIQMMEQDAILGKVKVSDTITVMKFPFAYNASANRSSILDNICKDYDILCFEVYEYWNYEGLTHFTAPVSYMIERVYKNSYTQHFSINRTPAKEIPTNGKDLPFRPVKGSPYLQQASR